MSRPVWSWEPGRIIARDGIPLLVLTRATTADHSRRYNLEPAEADKLAREIVRLLNFGAGAG